MSTQPRCAELCEGPNMGFQGFHTTKTLNTGLYNRKQTTLLVIECLIHLKAIFVLPFVNFPNYWLCVIRYVDQVSKLLLYINMHWLFSDFKIWVYYFLLILIKKGSFVIPLWQVLDLSDFWMKSENFLRRGLKGNYFLNLSQTR